MVQGNVEAKVDCQALFGNLSEQPTYSRSMSEVATRRIFVRGISSIVLFYVVDAVLIHFRPAPILLFVAEVFVVMPVLAFTWMLVCASQIRSGRWTASLIALACSLCFTLMLTTNWMPWGRSLWPLVQQIEFEVMRPSFGRVVAETPSSETPRPIRLSFRDVSPFCCGGSIIEEIWFDETDRLGSPDRSISDSAFRPWHSYLQGRTSYFVRPLGGHYYFIEIRVREAPTTEADRN